MRGSDKQTGSLFSYVNLEDRIPARHPLRKIKGVVDAARASLEADFAGLYADERQPSIASERRACARAPRSSCSRFASGWGRGEVCSSRSRCAGVSTGAWIGAGDTPSGIGVPADNRPNASIPKSSGSEPSVSRSEPNRSHVAASASP
jgi:hypothetical protein